MYRDSRLLVGAEREGYIVSKLCRSDDEIRLELIRRLLGALRHLVELRRMQREFHGNERI